MIRIFFFITVVLGSMPNYLEKLDEELRYIYENYLEIQEKGREYVVKIHPRLERSNVVPVSLTFRGNLEPIQQLGFQFKRQENDTTYIGALDLKNLESMQPTIPFNSLLYIENKGVLSPHLR